MTFSYNMTAFSSRDKINGARSPFARTEEEHAEQPPTVVSPADRVLSSNGTEEDENSLVDNAVSSVTVAAPDTDLLVEACILEQIKDLQRQMNVSKQKLEECAVRLEKQDRRKAKMDQDIASVKRDLHSFSLALKRYR